MSTTAVLISGQLRTFAQCYPTQRWQIFRHYEPDIHFFVSCVNDAQSESAFLLEKDYKNVHIERYEDNMQLPVIPIEKGAHAPYANAATHEKLMLQHWGNQKVLNWFQSKKGEIEFDTVIRIRPDQWVHRFTKPSFVSIEDTLAGSDLSARTVFAPWWGKFGGINDRLAIMGMDAVEPYFGMIDKIQGLLEKGCPFHPETLLAAVLKDAGIIVRNTLMAEMSTQRLDGSRRWPEISVSDLAELTYELSMK